jgi:hypothetical protein
VSLTKIFQPELLERGLKTTAPAALRELADSIERGDLKLFAPLTRGNGFVQARYDRIVMDVCFSLEVPCVKHAVSE